MPCSHPDPDDREIRQQEVAINLVYLLVELKIPVSDKLVKDAEAKGYDDYNGGELLDEWTRGLCDLCKSMTPEQENRLIYDGRNPKARKLADWWDKHKEADRQREKA